MIYEPKGCLQTVVKRKAIKKAHGITWMLTLACGHFATRNGCERGKTTKRAHCERCYRERNG